MLFQGCLMRSNIACPVACCCLIQEPQECEYDGSSRLVSEVGDRAMETRVCSCEVRSWTGTTMDVPGVCGAKELEPKASTYAFEV